MDHLLKKGRLETGNHQKLLIPRTVTWGGCMSPPLSRLGASPFCLRTQHCCMDPNKGHLPECFKTQERSVQETGGQADSWEIHLSLIQEPDSSHIYHQTILSKFQLALHSLSSRESKSEQLYPLDNLTDLQDGPADIVGGSPKPIGNIMNHAL